LYHQWNPIERIGFSYVSNQADLQLFNPRAIRLGNALVQITKKYRGAASWAFTRPSKDVEKKRNLKKFYGDEE
jgi:hypothetical protein